MSPNGSWRVPSSDAGLRLDVAVARRLEDVSRTQVKKWIEDGRVLLSGEPARPSTLCREGDSIDVAVPDPLPASPMPEPIPLTILFEDAHLIVVDKPAGMVVHPSPGHGSKTLVNALLAHCADLSGIGGVERPGIVHRLDAGTTGVLVVAKHDRAHRDLAVQFQQRRVGKGYVGVAHGVTPDHWTIESAIGRDPRHRTKISSRAHRAKPAVSTFRRLGSFPGASLLEIRIHTGRTHQIRVHLSEAGYPLVGDREYRAPRKPPSGVSQSEFRILRDFPRPALHAATLELTHPITKEPMKWTAELPKDMQDLLEKLKAKAATDDG